MRMYYIWEPPEMSVGFDKIGHLNVFKELPNIPFHSSHLFVQISAPFSSFSLPPTAPLSHEPAGPYADALLSS